MNYRLLFKRRFCSPKIQKAPKDCRSPASDMVSRTKTPQAPDARQHRNQRCTIDKVSPLWEATFAPSTASGYSALGVGRRASGSAT